LRLIIFAEELLNGAHQSLTPLDLRLHWTVRNGIPRNRNKTVIPLSSFPFNLFGFQHGCDFPENDGAGRHGVRTQQENIEWIAVTGSCPWDKSKIKWKT
jgi:hypothetical protein